MKNILIASVLALWVMSWSNTHASYTKDDTQTLPQASRWLTKESWDILCELQWSILVEHIMRQVQRQFDTSLRTDISHINIVVSEPSKKVTTKEWNVWDQVLLRRNWEVYTNGTQSEVPEEYMLLRAVPNRIKWFTLTAERNWFYTSSIDCAR
mgnify:CR=1 FL=1